MMKVAVLLFVGIAVAAATRRFDNYEVLRMTIKDDADKKTMEMIRDSDISLDFWDFPRDLMVSPDQAVTVKALLEKHDISYSVWIKNVQDLVDNQFTSKDVVTPSFYTQYHSYEKINQWVKDKVTQYPELAKDFVFAETSYEGRELRALKISGVDAPNKPAVWFEGGIHAREWASPATVMYITDQLLADYGVDPVVTNYLDTFDFYVHPLINPDGYEFSRSNDRMWRKTRSANEGSACMGTDGNRNFDYQWGGSGASPLPCTDTYHGPAPHSEAEVRTITEYMSSLVAGGQEIKVFIDFHSYSQLWLTPWSYTGAEVPAEPHYSEQMNFATAGVDATMAVYGTTWTAGPCGVILYEAAGNSNDYGYGALGAVYSVVVELRDDGEYGFLLPEDQIIPSGIETYAGVKAALDYVLTTM